MNKSQALHSFWSGFGLSAYDQYTVPDSAQMPYITYSVSESDFDNKVSLTASLWYKSQSWEQIALKSYQISKYISRGGITIPIDGGYLWICRGSPFAQRMPDTNGTVRRIVINIAAEYFTND